MNETLPRTAEDLGTGFDVPLICDGMDWTGKGTVRCKNEAEVRITSYCCVTRTTHNCRKCLLDLLFHGYECKHCGKYSRSLDWTPLR